MAGFYEACKAKPGMLQFIFLINWVLSRVGMVFSFILNRLQSKSVNSQMQRSKEQDAIVQAVLQRKSVIVDAVAGSGKTTTVKFIVKDHPNIRVLMLTFSRRLRLALEQEFNPAQVTVHNYHSLAYHWYKKDLSPNNIDIIVDRNIHINQHPEFDLIVIDEIQDMKLSYYRFVTKLFRDLGGNFSLLVMGDKYQGIFGFLKADPRFLTLAEFVFPLCRDAAMLSLKQSFRVTKPIAWFVNNAVLGEPRIKSTKPGPLVEYYVDNPWQANKTIIKKINEMMRKGELQNDDIFVLVNSTGGDGTPARELSCLFTRNGINNEFIDKEVGEVSEETIRGKAVFTTFHQAKGLERKLVIIHGFDNGFAEYVKERFRKDTDNPEICPAPLYVALTRATTRLLVIEAHDKNRLACLKLDYTAMEKSGHVTFPMGFKKVTPEPLLKSNPTADTVTGLVRYINLTVEEQQFLDRMFICREPAGILVPLPPRLEQDNLCEEVSDISAVAISLRWEYERTGRVELYEKVVHRLTGDVARSAKGIISTIKYPPQTESDYLKMALVCHAHFAELINRLHQIKQYDWLSRGAADACIAYLNANIPPDADIELEKTLSEDCMTPIAYMSKRHGQMRIAGRVDICTSDTVWEIKCVGELQVAHKLQVVMYAFLWKILCRQGIETPKRFKLLNIRSGELLELDVDHPSLDDIVNIIIDAKYKVVPLKSNHDFIQACANVNPAVSLDLMRLRQEEPDEKSNNDLDDVPPLINKDDNEDTKDDEIIEVPGYEYIPPANLMQAMRRAYMSKMSEEMTEPHCAVCFVSKKDGPLYRAAGILFCEVCLRIQQNM